MRLNFILPTTFISIIKRGVKDRNGKPAASLQPLSGLTHILYGGREDFGEGSKAAMEYLRGLAVHSLTPPHDFRSLKELTGQTVGARPNLPRSIENTGDRLWHRSSAYIRRGPITGDRSPEAKSYELEH